MFPFQRPKRRDIARLIAAAQTRPFSYRDVAATRPVAGFGVAHSFATTALTTTSTTTTTVAAGTPIAAPPLELTEPCFVDCNRIRLGQGERVFEAAKQNLLAWKMFDLGWAEICWPETPVEVGATVAVLARAWGIYSLNPCRVVYSFDSSGEGVDCDHFGFAYGTLSRHAVRGEERFSVLHDRGDDSVWYEILAFSRPDRFLSRAVVPLTRALQSRFAADSMRAMARAVAAS